MGHTETMAEGDEQYEMETTESGASDTHMVEAGQIRKGGYIMVKGKACKVKDVSVSKTGKHGHAKCKFSACASSPVLLVRSSARLPTPSRCPSSRRATSR